MVVNGDGSYTYTPDANFNGTDSFVVLVEDGQGGSTTTTVTVTVTPANDAPTASSVDPVTAEDTPVSSGILMSDVDLPGGPDVLTASLDPAPGSSPSNGSVVVNGDGSYTYTPDANFNGTDSFVVLVEDGQGGSTTTTVTVTVTPANDAPTASSVDPVTAEDTPVSSGILMSDVDLPGGPDVLTASLDPAPGSSPSNGSVVVNGDGSYTYTPDANFNGTDSFVVLVEDGQGGSTTTTVTVTVTPANDAPTASSVDPVTAEDTPVSSGILMSDVDLPGGPDVLTASLDPEPGSSPSNGSVVVNGDGSYTYTPDANFNGTDSFVVLVEDGQGGSTTTTVTVTVTPANDAPTASSVDPVTAEDTPVSSGILMSDVDLPGGPDVLTASLDPAPGSSPSNGSVVVNGDGSYTYTPDANFNGTDSFVVLVEDGQGGSTTTTVTVTVTPANDAPTVVGSSQTGLEDQRQTGAVSMADVDGDTPFATLDVAAAHGVVAVNPDGTWTYTPQPDFNGTDRFDVRVWDPGGASSTATVFITVTPVVDIAADQITVTEDVPLIVNVMTGVGTVGGSGGAGTDAFEGSPVVTGVTQGGHGSVTFLSNGEITYTPDPNYHGADSFSYTVTSGGVQETAVVLVNVVPVNDDPVGTAAPAATMEDTPVSGVVGMVDSDGDTPVASTEQEPSHGTVSVNADGSWVYTPELNFVGLDSFRVTIDDGNGGQDSVLVEVTVVAVNDAPQAFSETRSARAGSSIALDLALPTDIDDADSVLRSTIVQVPDASMGSLTYRPAGSGSLPVPVTAGLVLTNEEMATLSFAAEVTALGKMGEFVYRVHDDEGATDINSLATVEIAVTETALGGMYVDDNPFGDERDAIQFGGFELDPVTPFVVNAVNGIANLSSIQSLEPDNGRIVETVQNIQALNATNEVEGVDPPLSRRLRPLSPYKFRKGKVKLFKSRLKTTGSGEPDRILSQICK